MAKDKAVNKMRDALVTAAESAMAQGPVTVGALTELHESIGELDFILGFIVGRLAGDVGYERARYLLLAQVDALEAMA